jgi:hypothetical protein
VPLPNEIEVTEPRPAFLGPFLMLVLLGALGTSTLLMNVDDVLASMPAAQVAAAGGPVAVKAAMLIQPVILTALAAAAGLVTAHKLALKSWLVDRLRGHAAPVGVSLSLPVLCGLAAGAVIVFGDLIFTQIAPDTSASLRLPREKWLPALLQGLLYGGLTEEILLRWGVLSSIAFGLHRAGAPQRTALAIAAVLAAALFAAGHLPALAAVADPTPLLVARTLLLNTMAGVIFGYAFLRHSLEGAILAHGIGHVVIFAARVAGL